MRTRLAALGTVFALVQVEGLAQTRMVALLDQTWQGPPPRLVEIDVETARLITTSDLPFERSPGPLAVTADGRFVAWLGHASPSFHTLSALDRRTGGAAVVAPLLPSGGPVFGTYPSNLLTHPTEVQAFVASNDVLMAIDPQGARGLPLAGPLRDVLAMSRDGSKLLVERGAGLGVDRVDSRTGASLSHTNIAQPASWAMSPDGGTVYSLSYGAIGFYVVRAHDPVSGAVLRERSWKVGSPGMTAGITADPHTGRVFVGLLNGRYDVLDPVSLDRLGAIASSLSWTTAVGGVGSALAFDPNERRAYLLGSHEVSTPPGPDEALLEVWDTDTLARIGGFHLPPTARYMAIVPRPPTPSQLSAVTEGQRVTLTWSVGPGAGAATAYRVEAGSGPGLANIATLVTGLTPALVVDDVPTGSYYVRVLAVGTDTVSGPSNEIVVTIR
jgi:hypothetical protein